MLINYNTTVISQMDTTWLTSYCVVALELNLPVLEAIVAYWKWLRTRDYTKVPFPELVDFMWSIKLPHIGGDFTYANGKPQSEASKHLKGWSHINPGLLSLHTWSNAKIMYYYRWYTAVRTDWPVVHRAIVRRLGG